MGSVLVIGSSNTDLVCRAPRLPRPGETLRGTSFATFAGGKGANQAVAAARAGAAVRFVGAVGNDAFGAQRLADLAADGIDVSESRVVPGTPSGVALIVVAENGENEIVLVAGANDSVTPDAARAAVERRAHDVLSLTLEVPLDAVAEAISANAGLAAVVVNSAPFDARVRPLLPAIDLFICNEVEAGQLLDGDVTPGNALAAAQRLRDLGARAVTITLGAHGAVLATDDGVTRIAAPRVQARDTTGAGDAFCGAAAAWLAERYSVAASVRAGVVAGAIAVTRDGAQPSLPRRAEIEQCMRGQTSA